MGKQLVKIQLGSHVRDFMAIVDANTDMEMLETQLNARIHELLKETFPTALSYVANNKCVDGKYVTATNPLVSLDAKTITLTRAQDHADRMAKWDAAMAEVEERRKVFAEEFQVYLDTHPDNGKEGYWATSFYEAHHDETIIVKASSARECLSRARERTEVPFGGNRAHYLGTEVPDGFVA